MKTLLKYSLITFLLLNVTNAFAGANEDSCEPRIIYVDRIVEVEKEVYFFHEKTVKVDVTKKNRVSVLAGYGPTDNIGYTILSPTVVEVQDENRASLGVQYMRDLGRFNVLIQTNTNKSSAIGLGINF